jgi:segregation and condensation protein B
MRIRRGTPDCDPQFVDSPGARSPKLARVEAVLFAAGEPLSTRRIADAANLADGAEARVLVQQLKGYYEADASAFTVESLAGGWQLCTRPQYATWLEKLHPTRHPTRLSQPALETLAVVAYRQPILRADVESIRGVSCGEMLRQLIDRGLVRIVGHHDSLGRPLLYGTTRKFLEVFGLADLADLPIAEQLRQPAHARVVSGGSSAVSDTASEPVESEGH